ncbi:quaternary ammonium compound-resistance protein sugE [Klebsiella michiganensis]|nr:quaternary ammonium compound-resistance protein sugE [Klebsiella michiganensis]
MSWFILFIAGLLEVVWAVGLKYTHGFSRLVPSVITIAAMVISMALLSWAMKTLPVGTAYAVWTGIGAVGAAVTGIILLGESASPDAHCQPGVYCDWYHWLENERALILLIDPQQFADVESLPGSDIQHLLLHFWRDFRRSRQ